MVRKARPQGYEASDPSVSIAKNKQTNKLERDADGALLTFPFCIHAGTANSWNGAPYIQSGYSHFCRPSLDIPSQACPKACFYGDSRSG